MPRVANQPSGKSRQANKQTLATPHKPSPIKMSLNDDRTEKAARLQSRQALHDIQLNQIKAAASPMRKMTGYDKERTVSSSPRTPRSATDAIGRDRDRGKENRDPRGSPGTLDVVTHSAVTPMKRVPILANFEEWMKMATDNKINAANSWNFALIDYFHDMSLLKEGDGVNFQKASCTLDGCVKIYTSRVDSVASETGKLLSGLADSGGAKKVRGKEGEGEGEGAESGGDDDDEGEEGGGEDGVKKTAKRKTPRSHEQTLAPSFASLQLKKLELEFVVDPLFKKASADFDEGGAKGLLLNHLSIDSEGRIVFDSSDDAADVRSYPNTTQMQQTLVDPTEKVAESLSDLSGMPDDQIQGQEVDLRSLASKFFPDLSVLDSQDICPSMKSFALGDPGQDLNLDFLRGRNDLREAHNTTGADKARVLPLDIALGDKSGIFLDSENAAGFDDDDDDGGGPLGGFDVGHEVGFGDGGEAWAKDAALEPMLRVVRADGTDTMTRQERMDGIVVGGFDPANPSTDAYAVGLNHQRLMGDRDPTDDILSYFDAAVKSTKAAMWAGPEHWRIRRIKAAQASSENPAPVRTRKEKEPFEIDFLGPMDQTLADMLHTPASSNSAISLPKAQWKTRGRNLLPDDRHFNSRSLLHLWLKPKARVGRRNVARGMPSKGVGGAGQDEGELAGHVEMDEAYWAKRREADEEEKERRRREEEEERGRKEGDYDANFFADDVAALPFGPGLPDDDDDDENGAPGFTDAREMLSPPPTASSTDSQPPGPVSGFEPALAGPSSPPGNAPTSNLLPGSFGTQLVTQGGRRLRPEYVNYARVAKKVDVRRLKENMWRGMSVELMTSIESTASSTAAAREKTGETRSLEQSLITNGAPPTPAPTDPGCDDDDVDDAAATAQDGAASREDAAIRGDGDGAGRSLKFTSLIRDLRNVYPEHQMRDISTSYCFICLLHLANEKGLVLEGDYPDGGDLADVVGGDMLGEREETVMAVEVDKEQQQQQQQQQPQQQQQQPQPQREARVKMESDRRLPTGLMREITIRRDHTVGLGYVGE